VNELDVVDETFLAAAPAEVAAAMGRPQRWRRWWPDLRLTVVHDRGPQGVRWSVAGALRGTMEVWLEPMLDGTVLHHFLRAELPGASPAELDAQRHRRRLTAKAVAFELKAELEHGRPPGEPPVDR